MELLTTIGEYAESLTYIGACILVWGTLVSLAVNYAQWRGLR